MNYMILNSSHQKPNNLSRREWIASLTGGLGSVGLLGMLSERAGAGGRVGQRGRRRSFRISRPRRSTTSVLFMVGGPSQLDMFDPKPALLKYQGQRPDLRSICARNAPPAACCRRRLSSSNTAGRRSRQRACCRTSLPSSTTSASSNRCTRSTRRTRRRAVCSTRATSPRRALRWARGSPTDSAARTRTCPGFVVLSPGQSGGGGLARAGFLPAKHQGTHFDDSVTEPER